jgi:hypothetical protein
MFFVFLLFPLLNLFAVSSDCYEVEPDKNDSSYVYTFMEHIVVSSTLKESRCILLKDVPFSGKYKIKVVAMYTKNSVALENNEQYRLAVIFSDTMEVGGIVPDQNLLDQDPTGTIMLSDDIDNMKDDYDYFRNELGYMPLKKGTARIQFMAGTQDPSENSSNSVDFYSIEIIPPPHIVKEPPFTANYSNTIEWMAIEDGTISQEVMYFDSTAARTSGSSQQSLQKSVASANKLSKSTFSNLQHDHNYGYYVEAYTTDGIVVRSDTTFSTQDAMPPNRVKIESMRSSWNRIVELYWNSVKDSVSGVKAYEIVRSEDNSMETVYTIIDTIPVEKTCSDNQMYDYCYTDKIDDPDAMNKEYKYRIDAVDFVDNKSTGVESELVVGVPFPKLSFVRPIGADADSFYNGANITFSADVSALFQPELHKIKFQSARENIMFFDGQWGEGKHFFDTGWLPLNEGMTKFSDSINLAQSDAVDLQFVDGHTYFFRAQILDTLGNRSEWSDTLFVIPDCFEPDDITSLSAEAITNEFNTEGWMELAWAGAVDHTSGIDSFKVYRKIEGKDSTFQFVAHTASEKYQDAFSAIKYNGDVSYRIGSFDRVGNTRSFEDTQYEATARSQSAPVAYFVPVEDKDSLAVNGDLFTSDSLVWVNAKVVSSADTAKQRLMIRINENERELLLNPSLPDLYLVHLSDSCDTTKIQLRVLFNDKSSSLWSKSLTVISKGDKSGSKLLQPIEDEKMQVHNFPNPFNMDTSINFFIKNESQVVVDVYNIQGRKIKTLVNEFKNQGMHAAHWNGENSEGRVVSSGIYYYVIQIEDSFGHKVSKSQKMLLVK